MVAILEYPLFYHLLNEIGASYKLTPKQILGKVRLDRTSDLMNFLRFAFKTLVLLAFIFLYELLIHGVLLREMYAMTATVWRPVSQMEAMWALSLCYQLALAAWGTFVFPRLFPDRGLKKGLLFGLFAGTLGGILTASWYLWLNVPTLLGIYWFFIGFGEGLGSGIVLGLLYRKNALHAKKSI